ncbi:MAG: hypothetical protein FGM22_07390 [Burkholderiaceae bacterium]|nr:hypothetical protein [Burkholderiaceae bacterium]
MKMNTSTIVTIAAAIGGGMLATRFGGKKNAALATSAGVGLGVIAGQMIGEKMATSGSATDGTPSGSLQLTTGR